MASQTQPRFPSAQQIKSAVKELGGLDAAIQALREQFPLPRVRHLLPKRAHHRWRPWQTDEACNSVLWRGFSEDGSGNDRLLKLFGGAKAEREVYLTILAADTGLGPRVHDAWLFGPETKQSAANQESKEEKKQDTAATEIKESKSNDEADDDVQNLGQDAKARIRSIQDKYDGYACCLELEWLYGWTVCDWMKRIKDDCCHCPQAVLVDALTDMLRRIQVAVQTLHSQGLRHGDLHSQNIIVNKQNVWIIDYESACLVTDVDAAAGAAASSQLDIKSRQDWYFVLDMFSDTSAGATAIERCQLPVK